MCAEGQHVRVEEFFFFFTPTLQEANDNGAGLERTAEGGSERSEKGVAAQQQVSLLPLAQQQSHCPAGCLLCKIDVDAQAKMQTDVNTA